MGGPVNAVVPSQSRSYSYDRMGNRLSLTQGSGAEAITKQTPFQFMNKSQQPLRLFHGRTVELTGAVSAGSVGIVSGGVTRGASPGLGETGEPGGFRTLVQLGSPEGTMLRMIRLAYDYMGRRIAKTVWVWVPSQIGGNNAWRLEKDLRYVYDGWQMIAELDHTFAPPTAGWQPAMTWPGNGLDPASAQAGFGGFAGISRVAAERSVVRTYLWGQDLSGTMTGAGGVGGLLSVTHQGVTYHTCSDANGNITGLLAANGAEAGQLIARFDYDPFGNRLTNTGPDVEICPMGFSSKYTDSETGLVDYGLRIYSPPLARFLSRDPMYEITGEHPELMEEGPNLYGFVHNDPVNGYDFLGLKWKGVGKTKDERRLIWERDDPKTDTLEELAKKVDLDPQQSSSWSKPDEKKSCRFTTPNVWIMVKMLHGINSFRDIYTNPGDEIGDMFTFTGDRKTVNLSSPGAIVSTINRYRGDIIGLSIYGHGLTGIVGGTGSDFEYVDNILGAVDGNGFKLKEAHLMQCYSGAGGYGAAWKARCYKGRAKVYYGVNACGIDLGSKPKPPLRQ